MQLTLVLTSAERLDLALLAELRAQGLTGLSRARLKDVFRSKGVRLLGRVADPSQRLEPGSYEITVDADLAEPQASARPAPRGPFLPVIYEDTDLLVLNKTSGIPSAPHSPDETESAVSSALAQDPHLAGVGRGGLEPGLLHRLDSGTSGLLAFARTQPAYERLHAAWRGREVRKIYRAISEIAPDAPVGRPTTLWLGHDEQAAKRMRALSGPEDRRFVRGKPLETVTQLAATRKLNGLFDNQIEIKTGVMHQIRCTMRHWGSPIVGDPIYGGSPAPRLWLHAWKLALPRPQGGLLWIECPLPPDWPARQPGD